MDSINNFTAPQASAEEVRPTGKYGVVSTGAFFGLGLLYSIPVIGWIACIIMSFVPQNVNTKHFARAAMIRLIIGLVLLALICSLAVYVIGLIAEQLPAMLAQASGIEGVEEFSDDISNAIVEAQSGEYAELIEQLQSGVYGDTEELGNILEQVQDGDVLGIIENYQNGDYTQIIEKYEDGEYDDLIEKATSGELGDLGAMGELLDQFLAEGYVTVPVG